MPKPLSWVAKHFTRSKYNLSLLRLVYRELQGIPFRAWLLNWRTHPRILDTIVEFERGEPNPVSDETDPLGMSNVSSMVGWLLRAISVGCGSRWTTSTLRSRPTTSSPSIKYSSSHLPRSLPRLLYEPSSKPTFSFSSSESLLSFISWWLPGLTLLSSAAINSYSYRVSLLSIRITAKGSSFR